MYFQQPVCSTVVTKHLTFYSYHKAKQFITVHYSWSCWRRIESSQDFPCKYSARRFLRSFNTATGITNYRSKFPRRCWLPCIFTFIPKPSVSLKMPSFALKIHTSPMFPQRQFIRSEKGKNIWKNYGPNCDKVQNNWCAIWKRQLSSWKIILAELGTAYVEKMSEPKWFISFAPNPSLTIRNLFVDLRVWYNGHCSRLGYNWSRW